jgi:protein-arginine kinase activator protein McsA
MIDKEKVIKGLETCSQKTVLYVCGQCPYNNDDSDTYDCTQALSEDALLLLKEQEAKPVKIVKNAYNYEFYYCPNCNRQFYGFYNKHVYCDMCGQAVKWE